MVGPARVSPVPAVVRARKAEPSQDSSERSSTDRLKEIIENERVPKYFKVVIDLLMETRAEIREVTRRNDELMEEVKLLS